MWQEELRLWKKGRMLRRASFYLWQKCREAEEQAEELKRQRIEWEKNEIADPLDDQTIRPKSKKSKSPTSDEKMALIRQAERLGLTPEVAKTMTSAQLRAVVQAKET